MAIGSEMLDSTSQVRFTNILLIGSSHSEIFYSELFDVA